MQVGLQHFLVLAAILFVLGLITVVTRRNAVAVLIGIELLLNAAGINMMAFARYSNQIIIGAAFVLFIIVLAAAEAVVGLALILAVHRRWRSVDLERVETLKG
ncbi:MAG: NADH-quinone oxidoreductase subunit NuoK [Deltaproteobacteria bacterium]|nr:NADH-quinone oxidoreductase subunit NuoK [Deltaproteobacteria bacterium]